MTTTLSRTRMRVALVGIYHESNTFINRPTTLQNFSDSHWLTGEAIRSEYANAFHEIGGMLEVMDADEIEVIPVMFAEATPGGIVSKNAYERLLKDMLDGLAAHLPLDGCLVVPHGAGVAEGYSDMDGHWLTAVRKLVGDIPVVGTLDPHANVSSAMTAATNALVAYKTNPHIDQRETGRAAGEILVRCLRQEVATQQLFQPPVAISIEQQNTSVHPCSTLLELAARESQRPGILSVSLLLGFPYADVEDMGSAFIVVSGNASSHERAAVGGRLSEALLAMKEDCVGEMKDIHDILPLVQEAARPVLLLDMGDNIGGGSPGDSAVLLEAIEKDGRYTCLSCICDPQAVITASNHQAGDTFDLSFGNTSALPGGDPYKTSVTLLKKGDGKFSEEKPRHGGQMNFDMGTIAVVKTRHGSTVLLNSLRVPPFSLKQVTSFDIDPSRSDLIIAKGVNAPLAAYRSVAPAYFQVNTPGTTQADMTGLQFLHRRHPLFPFEK